MEHGRKPPELPKCLTAVEKRDWKAIVESLPANFLRNETDKHMLVQYIRHHRASLALSVCLGSFNDENGDMQEYLKVLAARDKEVRGALNRLRSLRLPRQSIDARVGARELVNNPAGADKLPWE